MSMSRKRVLWADDEIDYLRSHIMFLETRGYNVTPVYSGDDAIRLIHKNPGDFDIVLLDEQMFGKDGLTTLEEIKEFMPDLPVVMVTKSEEEHLMEDAMGRKIDGYLTKPVNPSQILSVCKKLLESRQIITSQIAGRYGRNYSAMRTTLQDSLSAQAWIEVYKTLLKWDFELEKVDDEGVRQMHAGQKSEAEALFSAFVQEHYVSWTNGDSAPPILTPGVLDVHCAPRLAAGERVYLFVLDSLRLDLYMAIEPLLDRYFTIDRSCYYSIVPTTSRLTRPALIAGRYPLDITKAYPDMRFDRRGEAPSSCAQVGRLLADTIARWGIPSGAACCLEVNTMADNQLLAAQIDNSRSNRLVVAFVNFIDLLIQNHATSPLLQEIAPDELALRRLTLSWFQYSPLFAAIKKIGRQGHTVILTSTNGCVLATRGTELCGPKSADLSQRYCWDRGIAGDERYALHIPEPEQFKLPTGGKNRSFVVLKENYHFLSRDTEDRYRTLQPGSFLHGGISMEEIILPVAVLRPR
jgi:CheY-like chemotaxis protein